VAGLVAGCSLGGGTGQSYPKLTLVARVFKTTTNGHEKVMGSWRFGCSPPSGPRSAVNGVWMSPKPAVACQALRDYVKLRSPTGRARACIRRSDRSRRQWRAC
jgi:hypothetical protein